jgi:hypothetical protein
MTGAEASRRADTQSDGFGDLVELGGTHITQMADKTVFGNGFNLKGVGTGVLVQMVGAICW